ncbi:PREDICTED: uncharacterized protein C16orf78 homolog [Elephantulus edwardii]|uniref:uncharacterized protein C16orf78 homolog n=1 Tax=Elephantulus edwardii TaxID=28737 RepID=UPI0003F0EDE2|nr:PREDICTED: uncharacterized protein C16orf78 homolog [Elephantulus edwardii]
MSSSQPKPGEDSIIFEKAEDMKDMWPTEHKSMWKTANERRMSDLTRVMEWLERRQGKKKQELQTSQGHRKESDTLTYHKLFGVKQKEKRLSVVPGNYRKDSAKKSEIDMKDVYAIESSHRGNAYRRQSSLEPTFQDGFFSQRRSTVMRDWMIKTPENPYEHKLKSLMEKGTEPKMESIKMLKPEEVLSCRYLRLSKNNIKTLLKLCKDAGLNVDIHPHMIEGEIDAKMVFSRNPSTAL